MKFLQIATFGATAVLAAKSHRHAHKHAAKHVGSPVEARAPDVVTTVVPGPTETVYELNGQKLDPSQVAQGIAAGIYVLIDPPKPTPTSTAVPTSSASAAAFFQKPSSSSEAAPTTSSPPAAATTSSTPPPAAATTKAADSAKAPSGGDPTASGSGLNSEFPSGTIPCSTFPSSYGPIPADWLKLGGWIGIQNVPGFSPGIDAAISYISTVPVGTDGSCTANSYCSYACPAGYQKSQWPASQGNTGQSIGGIYCNANGMLELSRPSVKQLCIPGTGQVKVKNNLGTHVAVCRTDYPGTESETVPLKAMPGQVHDLTCPDANDYYMWQGSFTSAQYYVNPSGVALGDACQWSSADAPGNWHGAPGNIGNWAPVNLGVGKGPAGTTFISLIPNVPTNPTGTLDFNIAITGDVSGKCEYKNGKYYNNGNEDPSGCTVSFQLMILTFNH
jgi:hypothetical protein